MPLPHLKKENNAEQEPFVSVDHEIAKMHDNRHPVVPAHEVGNPALDKDDKDGEKASDGS